MLLALCLPHCAKSNQCWPPAQTDALLNHTWEGMSALCDVTKGWWMAAVADDPSCIFPPITSELRPPFLSPSIAWVQSSREGRTKFQHDNRGIPEVLTVTVRVGPQAFEAAEQLKYEHQPVAAQNAVPAALVTRTLLEANSQSWC